MTVDAPAIVTIRVDACGHEARVARTERLLVSLRQAGMPCVKIGCLGGGCGTCKVRVLSGSYCVRRMSRRYVSAAEEAQGVALACQLIPETDLVVAPFTSGHR